MTWWGQEAQRPMGREGMLLCPATRVMSSRGVTASWLPLSKNKHIQAVNCAPFCLYLEGSCFLLCIWASPASAATQRWVAGALALWPGPLVEQGACCKSQARETEPMFPGDLCLSFPGESFRLELQTMKENPGLLWPSMNVL